MPTSQAPGSSFLTQIASQHLGPQFNPYFAQSQQSSQSHGYHHATVSSPVATPPIFQNQPPQHPSALMSPATETPQPRAMATSNTPAMSNADRTANLLNLLKFSQPAAASPTQPKPISPPPISLPQAQQAGSTRGTVDLLATLMGTAANQENVPSTSMPQIHAHRREASLSTEAPSTPADTQTYLLQLLNRPKPAQTDNKLDITPAKVTRHVSENIPPPQAVSNGDVSTVIQALQDSSLGDITTSEQETVLEPAKSSKTLFNYVNPFDQLAASSPRNRTPTPSAAAQPSETKIPIQILKPQRPVAAGEALDLKRKVEDQTSVPSPVHTKRKISSPDIKAPSVPGPTPIEALLGIGSTKEPTQTVTEALNKAGVQAHKKAEEALDRAVKNVSKKLAAEDAQVAKDAVTEDEGVAQLVSIIEKRDLLKDNAIVSGTPSTSKAVVENVVEDAIAESWETADVDTAEVESPDAKGAKKTSVKVYNFPLKPWISMTLRADSNADRPDFDPDLAMAIARLRKAFDQNDRTLVTATNHFIVFAMSKNGGIRIIRQDSGRDKKVFEETRDQIFNVSASVSGSDGTETVIGTGCSGTVYWAMIKDAAGEKIDDFTPKNSFALPPIQSPGDENPGGVLKTRARKSSTHCDFFAVGRGKSIHIIFPYTIAEGGFLKPGPERIVDIDKYLAYRTLKIDTGKAAKDFTFSQDDTTVVSLDKAGRVKFWDVRGLTSENQPKNHSIEIKEPLMTLITTPATEKSWPTSVIFVDKLRPYMKGGALRYLIVGMKQNHTLQLWDLALGKPVQEIHLPHDKESDAACSVVYHASTGVIVVGHPTRNSIYFIHLSAPKYNLPKSMSQSEFIQKLVNRDMTLPSPESTAVMSGIREYSFTQGLVSKDSADKRTRGDLRSLDILQTPATPNPTDKDDSLALFELYTMHSTGVTCISVKPETLGWDENNRALNPLSAEDEGLITVSELKPIEPSISREPTASIAGSGAGATATTMPAQVVSKVTNVTKEVGRKSVSTSSQAEPPVVSATPSKKAELPPSIVNGQESATSGAEKVEKPKKKKRNAARSTDAIAEILSGPARPVQGVANGSYEQITTAGVSQDQIDKALKAVEGNVSEMGRGLNASIDKIYQRFDNDKKAQAAASEEKQVSLLRLVSSTLAENVDQTLGSIVETNTKKILVPALSDSVSRAIAKSVQDHLAAKLGGLVQASVAKEVQAALPGTLGRALEKPEFLRALSKSMTDSISGSLGASLTESISSAVVKKVSFKVEENFATVMKNEIIPSFNALATRTAQKSAVDIQRSVSERINQLEKQRQLDNAQIDKLSTAVTRLTEMISTMATAQQDFQAAVLASTSERRAALEQSRSAESSHEVVQTTSSQYEEAPAAAPEQFTSSRELYERSLQQISQQMTEGQFETAMMKWISLNDKDVIQDIFEHYFSKYDPGFMREVSPILNLSTAATLSQNFDSPVLIERIQWVETILQIYQGFHPEDIEPVSDPCPSLLIDNANTI
jgi:hypothetical protein